MHTQDSLRDPEALTTTDGWFKTGETFSRDHEGYYYLNERINDFNKTQGIYFSNLPSSKTGAWTLTFFA